MRRWMKALGLATVVISISGAQAAQPGKDIWGAIGTMAGHTFVALHDGAPQTIVQFDWKTPGKVLVVHGLTSVGATFKAQYTLDPKSGRIQEVNQRGDKTYVSEYRATPDGFVEGGDQDGTQVRRIFRKSSAVTYDTSNQSLIKGAWQTTRKDGTFILASPEWIKSLGWKPAAPQRPAAR